MTMIFSQVAKRSPKTPSFSSATAPDSRQPKHGDRILGHFEENASIEQPQSATNNSALQTAVNATEPRHAYARSTDSMTAEVELQDRPISPDSHVLSGSGRELIFQTPSQPSQIASQAAEGGTSVIKSATLASPCGISNGMKIAGGATQSAAGEQVYDDAKRATSPADSASEGPPGTPKNGNEAAGAQNEVVEHATPEGSISPETPPNNGSEEATSQRNGDRPNASRLTALELQPLRCSPSADQDSGASDGPPCTCESTDSMPSTATSLSEHDAVFLVFPVDLSDAIPATSGMELMDEQSRQALVEA
ncbi:uncharacterized protein BBA_08969 [Beauveria bassiana ARSEF 2860]|uniref:Uncharacterized protein n=1 Tax=Beauveria bassiana (strain ARSEF 2860) TaxID=655819 RepID=J4VU40_BEAB2|nr:uncharacterized protein BBA_08969 [Beauveria bassiana ARSEF 2860]EJP62045.1 hypothetical protein BBA_08969 [Beauveria bassiana ARSEF 2860]